MLTRMGIATPQSDWYEKFLSIVDRQTGKIVKLRRNTAQRMLTDLANDQRKRGEPIRICVLKARRLGLSTMAEAMLFRMALTIPNFETCVVSHEQRSANAIFRMTNLFKDTCELKRPEKFSNRQEIEWAEPHRSAIRICAVGSEGIGRGNTIHGLHLSEVGYWSEAYAAAAFTSVVTAVPDAPGTMIIIESTANGVGGVFFEAFMAAQRGESNYAPLFIPWMADKEYSLDIPLDDHRWESMPPEHREDEPRLRTLGCTDKQLAFRRWMIGSKCQGDPYVWNQEYPATPDDAFISSGRPFFNPSVVAKGYKKASEAEKAKPAKRYTITKTGEFVLDPRGPMRVWEEPQHGKDYLICADVARGEVVENQVGKRLGDASTYGVWDREFRREIAVWHSRTPPDILAEQLFHTGKRYGNAEITVEANGPGYVCVMTLLNMQYPNVTRRQIMDKATTATLFPGSQQFIESGFYTTPKSRPTMLADMERLVRREEIEILEQECWQEMATFQYNQSGKPVARAGAYDDRVLRVGIACAMMGDDIWEERRRAKRNTPEAGTYDAWLQLAERLKLKGRDATPGAVTIG